MMVAVAVAVVVEIWVLNTDRSHSVFGSLDSSMYIEDNSIHHWVVVVVVVVDQLDEEEELPY